MHPGRFFRIFFFFSNRLFRYENRTNAFAIAAFFVEIYATRKHVQLFHTRALEKVLSISIKISRKYFTNTSVPFNVGTLITKNDFFQHRTKFFTNALGRVNADALRKKNNFSRYRRKFLEICLDYLLFFFVSRGVKNEGKKKHPPSCVKFREHGKESRNLR